MGSRNNEGPSGQGLLDELAHHGGTLTMTNPSSQVRASYRRAIWEAREDGLVSDGQRLRHAGRDRGDLHIWLAPTSEEAVQTPPLPRVPVPQRLVKPDPTVVATRDALKLGIRDEHGRLHPGRAVGVFDVRISGQQLGRALRLLQALVVELQRRGHGIDQSKHHGRLRLKVGEHSYAARLVERLDRTPHDPTSLELAAQQRRYGPPPRKYDYKPSGRLSIELDSRCDGRRHRWSDTSRWRLDDKLPELLHELALRAESDEQRRLERERLEQQRRADHERQRQAAREAMTTEAWREQLDQQVDGWSRAALIREYARELETRCHELPSSRHDTQRWVAWMRSHANDADPLVGSSLPVTPETPTFGDHEVEGWMREQRQVLHRLAQDRPVAFAPSVERRSRQR